MAKSGTAAPGGTQGAVWTVTVRLSPPANTDVPRSKWQESLATILAGRTPVQRWVKEEIAISFGVTAPSSLGARREIDALLRRIEGELHLCLTDLRLTSNANLDQEIAAMDHVGVGEAAEILGVSKQRVGQLAQNADFPEPVIRLRATPVWRASDMRSYAASRRTTPGAPLKKGSTPTDR